MASSQNLAGGASPAEVGLMPEAQAHNSPINVRFQDIFVTATSKTEGEVTILNNVSGECKAGRLLAIMGSSGAGKTTLLNALANRLPAGMAARGQVTANGKPVDKSYLRQTCYVRQTDALLDSATVGEAMMCSAELRLPQKVSREDKKAVVRRVLEELHMTDKVDTMIGTDGDGGLSGGQRRRLSVGVELVTDPGVLYLDEPTSGLDSHIALTLMENLRDLARRGRTVVCTIHQPNSDITAMFDDFMLLARGRVAYFGPWSDSVEYFAEQGQKCPMYKNPTDFYLSITSGNSPEAEATVKALTDAYAARAGVGGAGGGGGDGGMLQPESVLGAYAPPTSSAWQTKVLAGRFFRTWYRNPMLLAGEAFQYIFLAVFIGLMYLRIGSNDLDKDVFDRNAAIFFVLVCIVFVPSFSVITVWERERRLMHREHASGSYGLGAYFMAKTMTTFPFEIVMTLLFGTITYFMVGFREDVEAFWYFHLNLILFQLVSESVGLFCAVVTQDATVAVLILSALLIVLLAFGGFLVSTTPVYFKWIVWISYLNYSYAGLVENELEGLSFPCLKRTDLPGCDAEPFRVDGHDLIPDAISNGLGKWENLLVLFAQLVFWRGLCFALLLWPRTRNIGSKV